MGCDESSVGLCCDLIKGLLRHNATVPDQLGGSTGLLQLEHLNGFAAAVVDHINLNCAVLALQQGNSMRPESIAEWTGTCRITPILTWFRRGSNSAERFLRRVKQHETSDSGAGRTVHKLAHKKRLAIGCQLQVFGRAGAADDVDIAMCAARHQRRSRWTDF